MLIKSMSLRFVFSDQHPDFVERKTMMHT